MEKNKKKIIIGIAIFIAAAIILGSIYYFFKPQPQTGSKNVEIVVVNSAGEEKAYHLRTDAEYLEGVMEEAKAEGLTYEGTEGEFGLMLDTVNGEKAVFEEDGSYWSISVNEAYANYGVSEQPVADGDSFELRYTTGE